MINKNRQWLEYHGGFLFHFRKDIMERDFHKEGFLWQLSPVVFRSMGKDDYGWHDVGKIFLHELLHRLDKKASEQTIEKREMWLWRSFSGDQRNYLYVCLFAKLVQPLRGIRIKATIPRKRKKKREE